MKKWTLHVLRTCVQSCLICSSTFLHPCSCRQTLPHVDIVICCVDILECQLCDTAQGLFTTELNLSWANSPSGLLWNKVLQAGLHLCNLHSSKASHYCTFSHMWGAIFRLLMWAVREASTLLHIVFYVYKKLCGSELVICCNGKSFVNGWGTVMFCIGTFTCDRAIPGYILSLTFNMFWRLVNLTLITKKKCTSWAESCCFWDTSIVAVTFHYTKDKAGKITFVPTSSAQFTCHWSEYNWLIKVPGCEWVIIYQSSQVGLL